LNIDKIDSPIIWPKFGEADIMKGTSAPYCLLISAILSSSVGTINLSMNLDYLAASGSDPTIAIYIYTNLNFYLQCEAIIYNNILAIHKF